jgi:hypothetical protein
MRPTPSGSRMRTDPPPDRWRFDCEWPVGSHALVSGAIRSGECTIGVSGVGWQHFQAQVGGYLRAIRDRFGGSTACKGVPVADNTPVNLI